MPRKNVNGLQEAVTPSRPDYAALENKVIGHTKFGKALEIYRTGFGRIFEIRFVGGGELPADLKGKFVRMADAEFAIEVYLKRNESTLPKE